MTTALIGHTGFVGSNLLAQGKFDAMFNSKNIEEIRGRSFDRLVCAGSPGTKWKANKDPWGDLEKIARLTGCLSRVTAGLVTLISTTDIYHDTNNVDEDELHDAEYHHCPYGRHRRLVENVVDDQFSTYFNFDSIRIVRLPSLFGAGLKKNILYDLMHSHRLDHINPDSTYQWYPLSRLSADLATIEAADIDVINLVTEPIATRDIRDRFFPDAIISETVGPPVTYNVRTRHAALFGRAGAYMMSRDEVLAELGEFLEEEKV